MAKKHCTNCDGSGVLFFRFDGPATIERSSVQSTIERCDVCKRFKNDHTASKAVEQVWKSKH